MPQVCGKRVFISIHATREGGDALPPLLRESGPFISIHATREGGDAVITPHFRFAAISIHATREGGDAGCG